MQHLCKSLNIFKRNGFIFHSFYFSPKCQRTYDVCVCDSNACVSNFSNISEDTELLAGSFSVCLKSTPINKRKFGGSYFEEKKMQNTQYRSTYGTLMKYRFSSRNLIFTGIFLFVLFALTCIVNVFITSLHHYIIQNNSSLLLVGEAECVIEKIEFQLKNYFRIRQICVKVLK